MHHTRMRKSQVLYIRMALIFILLSFICYLFKVVRIPGDNVIVRSPDTTLHDIIYFNAENFVNLCGLIAFSNVCYFALSCYPYSLTLRIMMWFLTCMTSMMFCRCIGNVITYYIVTPYEVGADVAVTLLCLFLISKPGSRNASCTDNSVLSR